MKINTKKSLSLVCLVVLLAVSLGVIQYSPGRIPAANAALTAANITPGSGPISGGDIVTITGSGFEPDTPTIQNFGADKCATMTVYDGTNIGDLLVLTDIRDNQNYTVGKLADGNCWMLDNLKLGSTTGTMTLYGDDTNLGTGLHSTTVTLPQVGTTTDAQYDQPRAYGPVPGDTGTGATNYGYLYNWCAAKAGTADSCKPNGTYPVANNTDICPVNWRMPKGGDYDSPTNEFAQLTAAMASETFANYVNNFSYGSPYSDNFQFNGPFRGVFAGYRNGSSWYYQGSYASFWSGSFSPYNSGNAFYLGLNPFDVYPDDSSGRGYGFAVRCLTQAATTDSNIYDAKPTVTVDGLTIDPADVEVVSDTEIRVKMPAHVAGVVPIAITLGGSTQTVQYEYVALGVPNTGAKRS